MTKLYETTLTAISMKFFVSNMERIMRLFVVRFFLNLLMFPFSFPLQFPIS
jgi:hypothetical protein